MSRYIPTRFRTRCNNPNAYFQKTPRNIKKMAEGLMKYLFDNDLFLDATLYYKQNNKWIAVKSDVSYLNDKNEWSKHTETIGTKTYTWFEKERDPNNYFEYNGDYLSMSFEGPLYHHLNYSWEYDSNVGEELQNYFSHWGLYYELGYAWSFSLYE